YQRTPLWLLKSGRLWFTWIFSAAVLLIAWILDARFARQHGETDRNPRLFLASFAIMVGAILPTSGIVGFAFQCYSTVADRYMYLGMIGVALAVAALASVVNYRVLMVLCVAILPLMMLRSALRLRQWHDTLSITASAVDVNDAVALDHTVRAYALARLGRTREAIEQYQLAIRYDPTNADTYYNYGNLLFRLGQQQSALAPYREAITLQPNRAQYHHNYAVALMAAGDTAEAGHQFQLAAKLDPTSTEARDDYAKWLRMQKQ
ncbi:MAG TPA: tetratricopeptide repeat protein, partial [Tepidisphaeraceae bacterium]|nr:tetratricopeptide repeat protein [Tepidisphaeraceae bacterium]